MSKVIGSRIIRDTNTTLTDVRLECRTSNGYVAIFVDQDHLIRLTNWFMDSPETREYLFRLLGEFVVRVLSAVTTTIERSATRHMLVRQAKCAAIKRPRA